MAEAKESLDILPEILEYVLRYVDHNTLTIARLVSSEWNTECCRILRKCSIVHLSEYNQAKLKLFKDLLAQNELLELPFPFRWFNLELGCISSNLLVCSILEQKRLRPFALILKEPLGALLERGLLPLLAEHTALHTVQSLSLTLSPSRFLSHNIPSSGTDVLIFSNLREIQLYEIEEEINHRDRSIIPLSPLNLIIGIIASAQELKSLVSSVRDEITLIYLLRHAELGNLSRLALSNTTPHVFQELLNLKIAELKVLELTVDPDCIDEGFVGSEIAREVVEQYAETLEELQITWNFNCINEKFPFCPKLERLSIKYWSGGLGSFDVAKLPSLKRLRVYDCINELCTERLNPHAGVEAFEFECLKGTGVRFGLYSEEDFTQVIMNVNRQFPNLTSLDFGLALTASAIQRVILQFPKLKTLILESDNEYKECIFTGVPDYDGCNSGLEGAEGIDSCRTPSLLDLKCLEHLVLAKQYEHHFPFDVAVTDNVVELGFGRMWKLKSVQFDWEEGLSVDLIQKHLGHMSKIVINYADGMNEMGILMELKRAMPQVTLNLASANFFHRVSSRLRRSSTRRPRHRQLGIV